MAGAWPVARDEGSGGKLRLALALGRDPQACQGGARPEDGSKWFIAGREWETNPRHTLAPVWMEFVGLWDACRAGMGGMATWPDAGGVNDQPAWLVDAFGMLSAASAAEDKRAKGESA